MQRFTSTTSKTRRLMESHKLSIGLELSILFFNPKGICEHGTTLCGDASVLKSPQLEKQVAAWLVDSFQRQTTHCWHAWCDGNATSHQFASQSSEERTVEILSGSGCCWEKLPNAPISFRDWHRGGFFACFEIGKTINFLIFNFLF